MENLNAEQVKKALECCVTTSEGDCKKCGYRGKSHDNFITCTNCLIADALALINSQEQRIKELTEEKTELWEERNRIYDDLQDWKEIAEGYQKQFEDCYEKKAKLTEENERLRGVKEEYETFIGGLKPRIDTIRADTVRKMQERLKKYYHHLSSKTLPASVEYHIDQIANEMLKEDE